MLKHELHIWLKHYYFNLFTEHIDEIVQEIAWKKIIFKNANHQVTINLYKSILSIRKHCFEYRNEIFVVLHCQTIYCMRMRHIDDKTTDVSKGKEHRVHYEIPGVEGGAGRTPTSRRQSLFQRGSTSTRGA